MLFPNTNKNFLKHIFKKMELKTLIKNTEDRVTSYKELIEMVSCDKLTFNPNDELVIWYKQHLREEKNSNQIWLKKLVEEKTHENQGLNPPYLYR